MSIFLLPAIERIPTAVPTCTIEVHPAANVVAAPNPWTAWTPAVAGLIIAFVGWLVVERFARNRERRADIRELFKSFCTSIDDVVSVATEFYAEPGTSLTARALGSSVKAKISDIPRLLATLDRANLKLDTADQMIAFRRAVTGGQFEVLTREASQPGAMIFQTMNAAAQDLVRAVHLGLYEQFFLKRFRKRK